MRIDLRKGFHTILTLLFLSGGIFFPLRAESPDILFKTGIGAFENHFYSHAVKSLINLKVDYPDYEELDRATYVLGLSYFYLEQYAACIDCLKDFSKDFPLSPLIQDVPYWTGASYFNLGQFQKAALFLAAATGNTTGKLYPRAAYLYGLSLQKNNEYEKSFEVFSDLQSRVTEPPDNPAFMANVLFQLGNSEYLLKHYPEAIQYYKDLLISHSDSPLSFDATFYMAECYFLNGDYEAAEKRYQSVLELFPASTYRANTLFRLADLNFRNKQHAESLDFIQRLEAEFPGNSFAPALLKIKAAVYFSLEMYLQAIPVYEKLQNSADVSEKQSIMYNLGLAYQHLGKWEPAADWFKLAAAGADRQISRNSLLKLSGVYLEKGDAEAAQILLEEYNRKFPRSEGLEEVLRSLGLSYMKLGNNSTALITWDRLLREYTSSLYRDEYLFRRAVVHIELGNYKEALVDLNKILQLYPASLFFYEAYYNIGYIYSLRQEYVRSFEFFDFVLNAGPEGELRERTTLAKAINFYNLGDFTSAGELFKVLISSPRKSNWQGMACFYMGKSYLRESRLEKGLENFKLAADLLEARPEGAEALYWQGWTLFRLSRFKEAAESFIQVTRKYTGHTRVTECYFRAGLCYSLLDEFSKSNTFLNRAQDNLLQSIDSPLLPEILFQKGYNYLRLEELKLAEINFLRLHDHFPRSLLAVEGFYRLAEKAVEAKEWELALQYFSRIESEFSGSGYEDQALFQSANVYKQLNRYQEASDAYLALLIKFPASPLLGAVYTGLKEVFANMEDPRMVSRYYQHAMSQESLALEVKYAFQFEYACWLVEQDRESAFTLFTQLQQAGVPEPLGSQVNLQIAHYFAGVSNFERAFYIYKGIAGGNSSRIGAEAALNAARMLHNMNHKDEAFSAFLEVSFLFPDFSTEVKTALEEALILAAELGKDQEARKIERQLLEIQ